VKYTHHVSDEPLDNIRYNECDNPHTLNLAAQRFRRLWNEIEELRERLAMERLLDELRANGWWIGVHNDFKEPNGERKTFYLFTHPDSGLYVSAEGTTDYLAIRECAFLAKQKFAPSP